MFRYSGPFTVLLFEQDNRLIEQIESAFETSGIRSTLRVVRNLDEALAYFEGRGAYENRSTYSLPSLFLVNLDLKDESGWSFLDWYKKRAQDIRIPVVALMSMSDPVRVRQAHEAGISSCLVTPLDPRELKELAKAIAVYWGMLNQAPDQPIQRRPSAATPSDRKDSPT